MSVDALVRGVAAGEHLAVEQQRLAGLPGGDLFARQRVEVDAARARAGVVGRASASRRAIGGSRYAGPEPSSTKCAWRVAAQFGIIATGVGGVRRVVDDLDVEHGGQAAQALRADAERVDLLVELDAQLFGRGSAGRARCSSCMSMGSISDSLASSIAFSAVPPMPMPSMPGGHQPAPMVGTVFSTQSTIESDGLSIANFDLVLGAAALGRDGDVDRVARHELAC